MRKPSWERRYERRAALRYAHLTPWRPCYRMIGGVCLRCLWREITGANKRDKAAHLARAREIEATLPPNRYRKGADGRWRRESAVS